MNALEWFGQRRVQPEYLANFDSTTCMTRATAAVLRGEDFPMLGTVPRQVGKALPYGNYLPRSVRQRLYAHGGRNEAYDPDELGDVRAEDLRRWVVEQYPDRGYPAVLVGSANGAAVHLAALLGIPWLPQSFLLPVRSDVDPDDPTRELEWGRSPGRELLEANPDLQLHHMHDPNQDHLMAEYFSYFRVKSRRLGDVYEAFLERVLEPGGTVVLLECDLEWPTTEVADRHYFQFGAAGGLPPEEYFEGSDRVSAFLDRRDSAHDTWDPPEPDGERPEAEWGFEPALREDVTRFADERDYDVRRLSFEDTHDLSPVVADLYRRAYAERGMPTDRLVVSSFALMDPWWTLRTGSIPYWMTFNTEPDADRLESYLEATDGSFDEIHLMLFSNGVESAGQASADRWRSVLDRATERGAFLGADPEAYPADYGTYTGYHERFAEQIGDRYPMLSPVSLDTFETFLEESDDQYDVEFTDGRAVSVEL